MPGGDSNFTDWTHPSIEELFFLQQQTLDPAKRIQILRKAEDFLQSFEDNHWITLYWGIDFWPVNRAVQGFTPPQTAFYGFKREDLCLER